MRSSKDIAGALAASLIFGLLVSPVHAINDSSSNSKSGGSASIQKQREVPDKPKKWYCEAGSCTSGDGRQYECGLVLCDLSESKCGCSCIEVSNAPYPKGYCGKVSPYKDILSKPDDTKHWRFTPF